MHINSYQILPVIVSNYSFLAVIDVGYGNPPPQLSPVVMPHGGSPSPYPSHQQNPSVGQYPAYQMTPPANTYQPPPPNNVGVSPSPAYAPHQGMGQAPYVSQMYQQQSAYFQNTPPVHHQYPSGGVPPPQAPPSSNNVKGNEESQK